MPEPVAISYPDKSTHGLKVTIVGFTNDRSRGILRSLLSDVKDIGHPGLDSAKYQCVETSEGDILAISDEVNPLDNVSSDITFLYFNKMTLMNEDTAVQSVARALSSLMKSSEERSTKRSLIIILAGEVKDSEGMYNKTITYMDIAKEIVAENILAAGTLTSSIDTRVIVAPTVDVSKTASNMIKELISKLAVDGKLIESLYPDTNRTAAKVKPQKEILKREVIVGVGQLQDEVRESILVAQKALRDSLQKLLKSESATEFPTFLENLQTLCVNKMRKKAADKKITNKFILQCAEDEIRRDIFAISSNIFKNHVRVLQQQSIENFNKAAIDILENISVFMARDLQKARNKAVASFRAGIRKLTPKNAPVNWNCNFEVLKLEELIDAYIEERKVLARIDGILPRGRPPLELSFHVFLSHPTGRDYRQDVITGLAGDEPVYDSNIAKSGDILVKPSLARGILKQQLEENSHYGSLTKRDSEFAREMLMFPLSIKNPGVRLISAKGRRRVVAPKKDTTRADLGPERCVVYLYRRT